MTDKLSGVLGAASAGHRPEKEIVLLEKAAGKPGRFFQNKPIIRRKTKMKKIFALALAAIMTASMATVAFAATFDQDPDGIQVGIQPDSTSGWTTADSSVTAVYKLDSSRAENVVDGKVTSGTKFEGGNRLAIPLIVWDDDTDGSKVGEYDSGDKVQWYTKDVDYKKASFKVDWKVGDAEVDFELVKFAGNVLNGLSNDEYVYCAVITLPENNGNKAVDLAGTIQAGTSSTTAKKGNSMKVELSYMPNSDDSYTSTNFSGGTLDTNDGIVSFDQSAGEIDIDFDAAVGTVATFTVDVSSQGKLNMAFNTDFDKDFGAMYNYANLSFINFEGEPSFNKNGTMYIYAEDENTFVYEVTEDGAKAIDATWNEDYEAWEFKTRKLTSYVISDVELDEKTVTEDTSSSTTDGGKDNPDTGR